MRRLAVVLVVMLALSATVLQPVRAKTVELQPTCAGTIVQTTNSADTGASTPEELYWQSSQGVGMYEVLDPVLGAGQWLPWYSELSPPGGWVFRYRGFLRYDTSHIPNGATIVSAKLTIYHCEEVLGDGLEPFHVSLNRCAFERYIGQSNCAANFKLAVTSMIDNIDVGLSSDIPYDSHEVAVPVQWINKRGYTDMSILSAKEASDSFCLGEEQIRMILWWSEFPGRPLHTYEPVLVIEYQSYKSCDFCGKPIVIPREPATDPITPLSWYHIEKYVQGAKHPLVGDVCSTGCAIKWIEKHREEV